MRAHGNEARLARRFAIVIGVAAAGVMALGAQTASSTTGGPVDSACAPPTWSCPPDLDLVDYKEQQVGPGQWAVEVYATCGEVGIVWDGVHPASLPDLGCTVRAEGMLTKVRNDRLKPFHASIPGPRLVCAGQSCPSRSPPLRVLGVWWAGARGPEAEEEDAQAGPQGARRGQERQGEGHRPRDVCGRQRGDREGHDHTRRMYRAKVRVVGTTRSPRLSVWMEGPPRRPFSLPGREVTTALEAAGLRG